MKSLTPRQIIFRRFRKESTAVFGLAVVVFLLLLATFASLLSPYNPVDQDIPDSLQPPSSEHYFGTDKLGRDVYSRVLYGARLSMLAGVAVVMSAALLGTTIGLAAGYAGGWWDEVVMRVTDIFFAFPALILAMAIAGALGPSLQNALIAVAVVTWPIYARLVRGQVLVLRNREFIQAAHAIGASSTLILRRHLLPNTLSPILVQSSFDLGAVILSVAGLSFIGFGAQPPTPEWGIMISEGRNYIISHWWVSFFPAMAILASVAAFNLVGDGLRDVLDPRLRK